MHSVCGGSTAGKTYMSCLWNPTVMSAPHRLDLVVAGDVRHRALADQGLHEATPEVPPRLVGRSRASAGGHARAGDVGLAERRR